MTHQDVHETSVRADAPLTHDERKAAEAAFRGLPINPAWSHKAQGLYLAIIAVTEGRDIVTAPESVLDARDRGDLAIGV